MKALRIALQSLLLTSLSVATVLVQASALFTCSGYQLIGAPDTMTIFSLIEPPLGVSPALTPLVAASTSSLLTIAYVGNLYISTATRVGKARSKDGTYLTKDDEVVVRARLRTASWTTLGALAGTTALIRYTALKTVTRKGVSNLLAWLSALRYTGISLPAPSFLHGNILPLQPSVTLLTLHHIVPSIIVPTALTCTLYFGSFYVAFLDRTLFGQQNAKSVRYWLKEKLGNVWGQRNFVVGPLTEEVVFRGCIVGLHALTGASKRVLIFATPLYFGVAHVHHAYEGYVKGGRTQKALQQSTLISLFQFSYTCVFGWYANFLLLRTNSILAPFAAHVVCNMMNLPQPGDGASRHPNRKLAIWATHAIGAIGFAYALMPWTKPGLYGGSRLWR